jgi:hypothetical protein
MPSSKRSSPAGADGIADIGVPGAGYMWATRSIRNVNCCSPGQGPAVMLLTPSLATPVWIVGSRHAEELQAGIDRARGALPPEGWLPSPQIR